MEVSALKYSGGIGLHGRPSLLRLQSDERLIAYIRKGNQGAFEVLVGRYEARLLAFCRHLLGSREDAEDVLQEVMTAAFNAILADDRAINVRPWLYRIARNRSLNHLRRARAIASDEMDAHLSDHGLSTADKVHEREEFRLLVGDIHELPETQKTALVLREMDALSYEQIGEAMETTVPSVKSLLVRARVSLAEAAEARLLSCDEVRIELGEIAEGLRRRPSPLVRRHLRSCDRCSVFRGQLRHTNKALAALLPIGPLVALRQFAFVHLGHHAGTAAASHAAGAGAGAGAHAAGAGAGAAGAGAAGAGIAASGAAVAGSSVTAGGGILSAGLGAIAGKAAAGLAAAAIVTAGAVEADHGATRHHRHRTTTAVAAATPAAPAEQAAATPIATVAQPRSSDAATPAHRKAAKTKTETTQTTTIAASAPTTSTSTSTTTTSTTTSTPTNTPTTPDGRGQTQTDPTVLPTPVTDPAGTGTTPSSTSTSTSGSDTTTTTGSGSTTTTGSGTSTDPGSTSTATTPSPLPPVTVTTPGSPTSGEGSGSPIGITVGAPGR